MSTNFDRRRFLRAGAVTLVGAAGLVAGVADPGGLLSPGQPGTLLPSETPLPPRFRVDLPVPPVLTPVRVGAEADFYDIDQRPAMLSIVPGLPTPAWTYGGVFPGPTLRSVSGRPAVVTHHNRLPHPTVVHLHGGHTPATSDGYPTDLVHPAGGAGHSGMAGMAGMDSGDGRTSRTYTYPLRQRAATLWYHDHRMAFTGPDVWQGLAGFHLVTDDEEAALPLPRGERDLPLMICDRSFAADGSFAYPALDDRQGTPGVTDRFADGVLGDVILVNGAPWPVLRADRARYRLRILNASNARRYTLALDPQPPGGGGLVQIGSDGGLLERPLAHDTLEIAPAERFDVVVDFARYPPGTRVRLLNRLGSGGTAEVMRFDLVTPSAGPDESRIPAVLSSSPGLDPRRAVATREFVFQRSPDGWTVNGEPYQPGRVVAEPRSDTIEVWRFVSDFHHPVHLHLNHFQVLSRNGGPPGPYDDGWKDTVDVRPAEAVEIAVRFTDYPGLYMIHCHNLEHEDMAMMADFHVR